MIFEKISGRGCYKFEFFLEILRKYLGIEFVFEKEMFGAIYLGYIIRKNFAETEFGKNLNRRETVNNWLVPVELMFGLTELKVKPRRFYLGLFKAVEDKISDFT